MSKFLRIALLLALVGILFALSIPEVSPWGLSGGPAGQGIGKIRQLSVAVMCYHKDHLQDGKEPYFPKDLKDLLPDQYLPAEELAKLTKDISVEYIPPPAQDFAPNHLLFVGHIPHYVIYGFISGEVKAVRLK